MAKQDEQPTRIRRPITMDKIPPMTQQEADAFVKNWIAAIPKFSKFQNSLPIIYGTGGEIKGNKEIYESNPETVDPEQE